MATRSIGALPCDDATNGWANSLAPRQPTPSLEGALKADWVVVGAGFAGLAATRRLAENRPHDKIILLDAQSMGDGASARNSGFVIDLPHNVGKELSDLEAERRIMRLSRAALLFNEENVAKHSIACNWSRRGQYLAAVSPGGVQHLEDFTKELDALDEPYRLLDKQQTAAALGTNYYAAAVHTPGTALMQPAALVRGLADNMPENVTLHEQSPVTAIDYGERIRLETPGGSVDAGAIIIAVNGFAPQFGHYGQRIFSIRAFASLTRPLTPNEQAALGGEHDWGILPTNAFAGPTLRYTQDNRLLFRQNMCFTSRLYTDPADNVTARQGHIPLFRARFPMLPEVTFEYTWAGYLCLSKNFGHGFGQQAPNVFTAICQNAMGATKGTTSGMLVADLACGVDNPLIADMEALGQPERLPPRPFLDIGAWAKINWWVWQGRGER
jgi:glycine/D-amino acid oxidase-like deaminating enzyme